jgi:hypothetical protein
MRPWTLPHREGPGFSPARIVLAGLVLAVMAPARGVRAAEPQVVALDEEVRVRRGDQERLFANGQRLTAAGDSAINLFALRGETVALQVIAVGASAPLSPATLTLGPFVIKGSAGGAAPRALCFRQHYVPVTERSRNERFPGESLGWSPGARPPDDRMRGDLPDALIPLDVVPLAPPVASAEGLGWQAAWIDVQVPDDAATGTHDATVTVGPAATPWARFTLSVQVSGVSLPFRATSVFAFYEPARLQARIGEGVLVERQLWQLLHEHHIDALAPLTDIDAVDRLAAVFDGSLFSPRHGYSGPGQNRPPAVIALGAYGQLGEATPAAVERARSLAARLTTMAARASGGPAPLDIFLYAIDEQCRSPRAGAWRQALAQQGLAGSIAVGQTCTDPPAEQMVDVALLPGAMFQRAMVPAARAAGRRAWAYNGGLPHTGTLLLDAEPLGLIANGWIAALADIERWFYWETTFWSDDNRGGQGPIDPFATAANFHNSDGDTALGDGLLLYPGRQKGPPAGALSFGYAGVFPSLRLKMLRRGIQDAGLLALAAREHPEETAQLAARALPAFLDEIRPELRASWDETVTFQPVRQSLRALIQRTDPLAPTELRHLFASLAEQRRRDVAPALTPRQRLARYAAIAGGALLLATITIALRRRARRAQATIAGGRR